MVIVGSPGMRSALVSVSSATLRQQRLTDSLLHFLSCFNDGYLGLYLPQHCWPQNGYTLHTSKIIPHVIYSMTLFGPMKVTHVNLKFKDLLSMMSQFLTHAQELRIS